MLIHRLLDRLPALPLPSHHLARFEGGVCNRADDAADGCGDGFEAFAYWVSDFAESGVDGVAGFVAVGLRGRH